MRQLTHLVPVPETQPDALGQMEFSWQEHCMTQRALTYDMTQRALTYCMSLFFFKVCVYC